MMHPDISVFGCFCLLPMKNILTVCLLFIMVSCAREQSLSELIGIESYISERPEEALAALDSLSSSGDISGREANAKFALLYSIALDKNGIDSADDSLINVAVNWYRRHGAADEKLKAYYCQGRVYQNGGDNEAAMESFVLAQSYSGNAKNNIDVGILYLSMAYLYMDVFDYEKALEYSKKAEICFQDSGDTDRRASALLSSAICYFVDERYDDVATILNAVRSVWDSLNTENKNSYYLINFGQLKDSKRFYELSEEIEKYIQEISPDDIDWLCLSEYWLTLGETSKAASAIERYKESDTSYKSNPVYYIQTSNLYDSLGFSDKALTAYKKYSEVSDSLDLAIFSQDTKFIEDKYEKSLQIVKARNSRTMIILISLIVTFLLAYIIHQMFLIIRKRESEKKIMEQQIELYRKNYEDLKTERDTLAKTIERNPPADRQSRTVLNDRLQLLDKFFTAAILDSYEIDKKASKEIEQLVADRDKFLYTTRMTFVAAHPGFISFLESKGLSEWEIEYCCLYAIGLKGKDIGFYLNKKRHYNDSSEIRSKLGLGEHDTNLGNFLKKQLAEL